MLALVLFGLICGISEGHLHNWDIFVNSLTKRCEHQSTCLYRDNLISSATNFLHDYNCFCSHDCGHFGDCCNDVTSDRDPNKLYRCLNVAEVDETQNVRLIAKCPNDWKDDWSREQCEKYDEGDEFLRIPARGNRTGWNYRNMFCALCSGEHAIMWTVEIECRSTRFLNITHFSAWNQSANCNVRFLPTDGYTYRPCIQAIDTCLVDSENDLAYLCRTRHASYVFDMSTAYKNVYCALCNSINVTDIGCLARKPGGGGRSKETLIRSYPFAILMDMNMGSYESRVYNRKSKPIKPKYFLRCGTGMIYDHFSGKCRQSWCRKESLFVRGACEQTDETSTTHSPREVNRSDCVWIKLNITEKYTLIDGYLLIKSHDKNYSDTFYDIVNGEVFVCSSVKTNNASNDNFVSGWSFSVAQSYVTTIGLVISSIALTLQLTVYLVLSPLRNLPGKNLMHLCAALLVANVAFLVSPHLSSKFEACAAIAVVIHFSFLLAFSWMNIMSFDIWYTFRVSSMHTRSKRENIKRYVSYIAFAWLTATVIVLSALILDYTENENNFKPLYGHNSKCWINNRLGLLVFFVSPSSLLMVSNIFFYIMTVYSIVRIDRATKVASNNERHRFFLYVKLCVIMGLTWLFGFLAAFTNVTLLWYVFTVFNSLQGLFICVSFVFTRKVLGMLRDKFMGVAYSETSSSSNTASTLQSRLTSFKSTKNNKRQRRQEIVSSESCYQENYACDSLERFYAKNKLINSK